MKLSILLLILGITAHTKGGKEVVNLLQFIRIFWNLIMWMINLGFGIINVGVFIETYDINKCLY